MHSAEADIGEFSGVSTGAAAVIGTRLQSTYTARVEMKRYYGAGVEGSPRGVT